MNNIFFKCIINKYEVYALRVLQDNLIYLLRYNNSAILIDAGEAKPVLEFIKENNLDLIQVLITHSHHDHTAGCMEILNKTGALSRSPGLKEEMLYILGTQCQIISTPGHTSIHKSFYFPDLDIIFTGDFLINGGCGRLLGGTVEQLFNSFKKLYSLPASVRIFGGHDYLEENLKFSYQESPKCDAILKRMKDYNNDKALGLFLTLEDEKETNPFMRCNSIQELSELRSRKDRF